MTTRRVLFVAVMLCAVTVAADAAGNREPIGDKTLVAWVAAANLTQRGGSVLTIEKPGGIFDAVVFGEIEKARWMAGSNGFTRTNRDQAGWPAESADGDTLVQIAIVYEGNHITIYRNGALYAEYAANGAECFGDDSLVLMGLRHRDASPQNRFLAGAIDDARIYNTALDRETIASLAANKLSEPPPYAWWHFEDGKATDEMNAFGVSTLFGDARIQGGRLHLDGKGAYMMADTTSPGAGQHTPEETARALREKILSDPSRPDYHFVIPEGVGMPFDPNGAIYWKGRYHLFYIFQDTRSGTNDHHWGHVSSTDLFHWRHHPTGLIGGMFSGNCFINKKGQPTVCYHQVGQGNAMAVALDDDLNKWKKLDSNPITPKTEKGDEHHGKYESWDPYGWLEGDTYYAIFGGKRPGIAKSNSLKGEWEYVGDLFAHAVDGVSINEDVSCADFFKLGGKDMLLCISHQLGCRYYLGEWKNEQFYPELHAKMSWNDNSFFAPESLKDDRGRRIMWAWIFDTPAFGVRRDYGWSGTMSLPRVLWLGEDGRLRMDVPEEIEALRCNAVRQENLTLQADADLVVEGVSGTSLELAIDMESADATQFGVKVCCSPNGEEETVIFYDAVEKTFTVDTQKSGPEGTPKGIEAGPFALDDGERLKLRVFVDKSVVEVFANRRQAVMRRIYPSRPDSIGVRLFANGGDAHVHTLEAWTITPSNPY